MYPIDEKYGRPFNPIEVPIFDILAVEAEKEYEWCYPFREMLTTFQSNRGLSWEVLERCQTRELILNGDQLEEEQLDIIAWHHERMVEDNVTMPNSPLSFDVEQVRCTLRDVLGLGGQEPYKGHDTHRPPADWPQWQDDPPLQKV